MFLSQHASTSAACWTGTTTATGASARPCDPPGSHYTYGVGESGPGRDGPCAPTADAARRASVPGVWCRSVAGRRRSEGSLPARP